MALTGRLSLASSGICCAVIAVYIAFAILQFNQIRAELERERITILAERVATPFEAAVRIGLPLASVHNAEAPLERARQLDPAIEAVFVLGPQGDVVRSVGKPEAGVAGAGIVGCCAIRGDYTASSPPGSRFGINPFRREK